MSCDGYPQPCIDREKITRIFRRAWRAHPTIHRVGCCTLPMTSAAFSGWCVLEYSAQRIPCCGNHSSVFYFTDAEELMGDSCSHQFLFIILVSIVAFQVRENQKLDFLWPKFLTPDIVSQLPAYRVAYLFLCNAVNMIAVAVDDNVRKALLDKSY